MPQAVAYGRPAPRSGFPDYDSKAAFDFAIFINKLHSPGSITRREYLQVRVLNFHLPFDSMLSSGIMHVLQIRDPRDVKRPPPHRRPAGDLGVAADMCRSVLDAHQKNPSAVPDRKWWQIIVWLLRRCINVETIEVPPEWLGIRWYPPRFPEIDPRTQRQLGNARWRWGEDPESEDIVEVLDERSLQFE